MKNTIKINRRDLHTLLWSKNNEPRDIARAYSLTQGNLKEICKFLRIPFPTPANRRRILKGGYYHIPNSNLKYFEDTPKELDVVITKEGEKSVITYDGKDEADIPLKFLSIQEREFLLSKIHQLIGKVNNGVNLSNRLLKEKVKMVKEHKSTEFRYANQSVHNIRNDYHSSELIAFDVHTFTLNVIDRFFDIIGSIEYIINAIDGYFEDDFHVNIKGAKVFIEFYEMQDTVEHVLTAKEKKELADFDPNRFWSIRPRIRKEDYIFNGRIVMRIKEGKYSTDKSYRFADTKSVRVEDQLFEIIICLLEVSETTRLSRIAQEEAKYKLQLKQEAEKRFTALYNEDLDAVKDLIRKTKDHKLYLEMTAYIDYQIDNDLELDIEWIRWARNRAEWVRTGQATDGNILGDKRSGIDILEMETIGYKKWR